MLVSILYELNFVTACDMPFINKELVKYLVDRLLLMMMLLSLLSGGYPEPAAVYRRTCIKYIENVILADIYQVNLSISLLMLNIFRGLWVLEKLFQYQHKG